MVLLAELAVCNQSILDVANRVDAVDAIVLQNILGQLSLALVIRLRKILAIKLQELTPGHHIVEASKLRDHFEVLDGAE